MKISYRSYILHILYFRHIFITIHKYRDSRKHISLRAKKIYLAFANVMRKYGIWKS